MVVSCIQTTRGRRPGDDDVDVQARLPGLVNNSYYRNVLCEYSAFFAIAYRIDFLHRHPWIGFQHWRASSKNVRSIFAAKRKGHQCYFLLDDISRMNSSSYQIYYLLFINKLDVVSRLH